MWFGFKEDPWNIDAKLSLDFGTHKIALSIWRSAHLHEQVVESSRLGLEAQGTRVAESSTPAEGVIITELMSVIVSDTTNSVQHHMVIITRGNMHACLACAYPPSVELSDKAAESMQHVIRTIGSWPELLRMSSPSDLTPGDVAAVSAVAPDLTKAATQVVTKV